MNFVKRGYNLVNKILRYKDFNFKNAIENNENNIWTINSFKETYSSCVYKSLLLYVDFI